MKKLLSTFVVLAACAALAVPAFALTQEDNGNEEMNALLYGETLEPEAAPAQELSGNVEIREAAETQTYSSMVQRYEVGEITEEELNSWLQENYLYKGTLLVKEGLEALKSDKERAEVDIENIPKDLKEEDLINEDGKYYVTLESLLNLASDRLKASKEDYEVKENEKLNLAFKALASEDSEKAALSLLAFYIDGTNEAAISSGETYDENEKKNAVTLCMIADAATAYKLASEQIGMLSDAGIITGIKDYTIENGTDIKISDLVAINTAIVKNIQIDDSEVLYDIDGSYTVYWHIIIDIASLKAYEEEKDMDFMLPDENLDFVTESMVTIVSEETDGGFEEETAVIITKDNKNDVIAQTTAQATENVTTVTERKKNQEITKVTESDTSSSIDRVNTATTPAQETTTEQKETQPQTQPEPARQTEAPEEVPTTAHIHSYEVAESIPAACETDGYIIYRCTGCGNTYSEPIYAAGHNWVEVSQGWIVNRITKVVCKWCEEQFDTDEEWEVHSLQTGHGNYTWRDVEVSREPVSDDLAQTWTYIGDQCSICGAWR